MLATAMLLTAVMMLSRVAFLARRHAESAEDQTQSQLLCHNLMQEILAGIRPRRSVSPQVLAADVWIYMVDVESLSGSDLSRITVQVDRWDDPTGRLPSEDEMAGYRLVRWVRAGRLPVGGQDEPGGFLEF
jgi:hypothetical protein